jgi:hypothetical protein
MRAFANTARKNRGAIRIALPAYPVQVWINHDHKRFTEFLE